MSFVLKQDTQVELKTTYHYDMDADDFILLGYSANNISIKKHFDCSTSGYNQITANKIRYGVIGYEHTKQFHKTEVLKIND